MVHFGNPFTETQSEQFLRNLTYNSSPSSISCRDYLRPVATLWVDHVNELLAEFWAAYKLKKHVECSQRIREAARSFEEGKAVAERTEMPDFEVSPMMVNILPNYG